jgi:uncharacterized protein YjbJ (UPF0337 family)
MVNKLELKGHWNQIKGKLKEKFGELTDNDLMYSEGREEELLGRIQKRTGKTKREIEKEIEGFLLVLSR